MIQKIEALISELTTLLNSVKNQEDLEACRIAFLGKKGSITELMQNLKAMSLDEKKEFGPKLQALKIDAENRINTHRDSLIVQEAQALEARQNNFDVTATQPHTHVGHLHPYTQFIEEIETIFLSMGYEIWDGPEFETDFYNFTALNIPQDHPARDMYDTFWTNKKNYLLRTHTSPVQIRAMQNGKPPFAGIAPGRTYRHEAVDASQIGRAHV